MAPLWIRRSRYYQRTPEDEPFERPQVPIPVGQYIFDGNAQREWMGTPYDDLGTKVENYWVMPDGRNLTVYATMVIRDHYRIFEEMSYQLACAFERGQIPWLEEDHKIWNKGRPIEEQSYTAWIV